MSAVGLVERRLQVVDDQRVRACIDFDRAALRERALDDERLDLFGCRVAERRGHHVQLAGQRLLLGELTALLLFLGQRRSAARRGRSSRRASSPACWRAG